MLKTLAWGWIEGIVGFGLFVAGAAKALPSAIARRLGEVIWQFERVAVSGFFVTTAAGLCMGAAAWMQTYRMLVTHGAESTLPSFLAVAVLVEIGPLLAGLLVAARMGAGLAAELATMVLNEEIDARRALGVDIMASLVAPRAIACLAAVPLLTIVIDAAAVGGGLAAESVAGRMSPALYWSKSLVFLRMADVVPATLKTAVFGFLIATSACWTGLNSGRSTEDVGRAAIRGVVRGVTVVFVANVLLIPIIQAGVAALGWRS